ncbi:variable large family protein [Borreliella garinii]|uniref:variable large family protein n=1 Tax=Borreliella garinii TaxID=29519 RepID=UPI00313A2831
MKKISSAILLATFFVFTNCKNNVEKAADSNDSANDFYQSVIKLGNGFLDVFTSFGGLIADAFGLKADPKKSEVKDYFNTVAKKLEETVSSLSKLPKDNKDGGGDKKGTAAGAAGDAADAAGGSSIEKAIGEISKQLSEMVKAAKEIAGAADGAENIGDVGSANNKGAGGDQNSVNGIANGMKAIVDAAGGVEKVLKDVGEAGGGGNNNNAGKLFAGSGGNDGAAEADVGKAVAAVNAVSGEQILKAIVDAAGGAEKVGAAAGAAKNPIAAAIGTDNGNGAAFADNGMQNKNDKIAAAIVLRGMAKGGKFSLADQGSDAHKAGVKSAAQSGTAKTVNALTSIIQKAAEEGLKKVADAVKGIAASGPVINAK